MPWSVKKASGCPPGKPWAVVNDETGRVVACHKTEAEAESQKAALYANVED